MEMTPTLVAAPQHGAGTPHRRERVPAVAAWVIALAGAVLAGMLSSFGQGVHGLSTLSNSAGPWFVVAAALVLVPKPRLAVAMPLGVVLLELMHIGYWAATTMRGYPDFLSITNFWVLMGVPAGLLAGLVATWVRRAGWHRAFAAGLVTAILVGEGIRSLLQVAATTGVTAWVAEIAVGLLVVAAGVVFARRPIDRVIALGTAVFGTAAVMGAYLVLGG
jgi:hypothetical protein